MGVVRRDMVRRWSLVGAGVAVLCAVPVAAAHRPVPSVRVAPATLRAKILDSASRPYQGTIDSEGGLGVPALPQLGDAAALLSGSTSIRAWYASPDSWRVAQSQTAGERDIYQTATGTYLWDFQSNLLTHILGTLPVRLPWAADLTPPDLARRLVRNGAPGDRLSALPARRVAGVVAAGVRLTPADPDTTISRIDIWADPDTGLPVQVEVGTRTGVRPAFDSRFLQLDQRAPDPGVVTPQRARAAGYTETDRPDVASAINSVARVSLPAGLAGRARVAVPGGVAGVGVYGGGLSRFVVIPLPGRVGWQSMRTLRDANATPAALADGFGYQVTSAAVTTLVVRAYAGDGDEDDPTFLLAGLVSPDLLGRAATDLLGVRRR